VENKNAAWHIHAAFLMLPDHFDAGAEEAGSDEAGVWLPASPCMSTLSPPLNMTNNASAANAMKPAKIFHMASLLS
jgi:hypothetical protein